jgi:hypothetical protein
MASSAWYLNAMAEALARMPDPTIVRAAADAAARMPDPTIVRAAADAAARMPDRAILNAMAETLARMPDRAILNAAAETLARMPDTSILNAAAEAVARMLSPSNVITVAAAVAGASNLSAVADVIVNLPGSSVESEADSADLLPGKRPRQFLGLGELEITAMVTTAVFLIVYICFSLAIIHDPTLAELAHNDGPTPFEAALAAGGLTYWFLRSRRSS